MRRMFALPGVVDWFKWELPKLETDGFVDGALTPLEQAAGQIHSFVVGESVEDWMVPKLVTPKDKGVWELRTPDLRIFGWFHRPCDFIISNVATAAACKEHDLYHGFQTQSVWHRDQLDLDPPKFTEGGIEDVF